MHAQNMTPHLSVSGNHTKVLWWIQCKLAKPSEMRHMVSTKQLASACTQLILKQIAIGTPGWCINNSGSMLAGQRQNQEEMNHPRVRFYHLSLVKEHTVLRYTQPWPPRLSL